MCLRKAYFEQIPVFSQDRESNLDTVLAHRQWLCIARLPQDTVSSRCPLSIESLSRLLGSRTGSSPSCYCPHSSAGLHIIVRQLVNHACQRRHHVAKTGRGPEVCVALGVRPQFQHDGRHLGGCPLTLHRHVGSGGRVDLRLGHSRCRAGAARVVSLFDRCKKQTRSQHCASAILCTADERKVPGCNTSSLRMVQETSTRSLKKLSYGAGAGDDFQGSHSRASASVPRCGEPCELDPVRWTSSERRIRCPEWPRVVPSMPRASVGR